MGHCLATNTQKAGIDRAQARLTLGLDTVSSLDQWRLSESAGEYGSKRRRIVSIEINMGCVPETHCTCVQQPETDTEKQGRGACQIVDQGTGPNSKFRDWRCVRGAEQTIFLPERRCLSPRGSLVDARDEHLTRQRAPASLAGSETTGSMLPVAL